MKTVSLELAKKMKELGWCQRIEKGIWFFARGANKPDGTPTWSDYKQLATLHGTDHKDKCGYGKCECECEVCYPYACTDLIPAPTLTEILEELPAYLSKKELREGYVLRFNLEKHTDIYLVGYERLGNPDWFRCCDHKNPAEAAGLLWCKLKEEKII